VESPGPNANRKDRRTGGRISLQTLIIASLASAAASFAASRIWGAGTIISAAITPVIVALVSEFLRRPVQTVAETAKKVPTIQTLPAVRSRTLSAPNDSTPVPEEPTRVSTDPVPPAQPHSPAGEPGPGPGPGRPRRAEARAALDPVLDPATTKPTQANSWRPRWRLAIVTGLLAFAIVVALYTVPDLLAGRSITDNGQPTTFFGGSATVTKKSSPTLTVTTSNATTVTKSTPTTTVTKTAPATTTPTTTSSTTTSAATSTTSTAAPAGAQTTTTPTTNATPKP
jgi:hypothetical protein